MNSIGIDIGGTKIAIGVVDCCYNLLQKLVLPTSPISGFTITINKIHNILKDLSNNYHFNSIGVCCPGPLDLSTGIIHNEYTLPSWQGHNLKKAFTNEWNLPITIEHDVNAALIGNMSTQHIPFKNVVMLSFGTGVGASIMIDNSIFRTSKNHLQDFGHIVISDENTKCYCDRNGCLETLTSGKAFTETLISNGYESFNNYIEAENNEEDLAASISRKMSKYIDTALWNFTLFFDPECFILGGGLMDSFYPIFKKYHNATLFDSDLLNNKPIIMPSPLKNNAGIIGSAILAQKELLC